MKLYKKPEIKLINIDNENLLAGSARIGMGADMDGNWSADARRNVLEDDWDEDEDY